MTKRKGQRKGQGLVEFALIAPLLLFLSLAVVEGGWIVFNYVQLNNAMREALRYGSVPSFTGVSQYRDCTGIYKVLAQNAQFAGMQESDVVVYYDNGFSNGPKDSANVIGTCSLPGPYNGTLINGQRVVIQMTPTVKFLDPFFQGLWPGMTFGFRGARTMYPGGVSVQ